VIITDLLGARVFGTDFVGFVTGVRFTLDIRQSVCRLGSTGSSSVRSPWPIAALVHWRHRRSFPVRWADIERFDERRIQLRLGLGRASSEFP
jgi:hypothetical protein